MNNYHPSTIIDIPGRGKAEIDNEMIPLIIELNKIGLVTTQCCQGDGHDGRSYEGRFATVTFDLKGLQINIDAENGENGTVTLFWNRL